MSERAFSEQSCPRHPAAHSHSRVVSLQCPCPEQPRGQSGVAQLSPARAAQAARAEAAEGERDRIRNELEKESDMHKEAADRLEDVEVALRRSQQARAAHHDRRAAKHGARRWVDAVRADVLVLESVGSEFPRRLGVDIHNFHCGRGRRIGAIRRRGFSTVSLLQSERATGFLVAEPSFFCSFPNFPEIYLYIYIYI